MSGLATIAVGVAQRRGGVWWACGLHGANVLFLVVNERHLDGRPMIFTTYRPLAAWGQTFFELGDTGGLQLGVSLAHGHVLVPDISDDFLDHILDRDEAGDAAIFIDDHREALPRPLKLALERAAGVQSQ